MAPTTTHPTQLAPWPRRARDAMARRRGIVAALVLVVLAVLAVAVVVASGGPRTGGPLARPDLFWEDEVPIAPGQVLTWGMVLPPNGSSEQVTMLSVEPTTSDGLDVIESFVHDPDTDGAIGPHRGTPPDGLHALPVEGAVMAPGRNLEAVFVVRVAEGHDRGTIPALRLRYRQAGVEYEDVVRLSLVVRTDPDGMW